MIRVSQLLLERGWMVGRLAIECLALAGIALGRSARRRDMPAADHPQMSGGQRLQRLVASTLSGHEIIVVSNREPVIHRRVGDIVVEQLPASGLVTALEPVVRACSGIWIAHGSGTADRIVVDSRD